MSNGQITLLVAVCAGLAGLAAFVGLVMVPIVSAYERAWERVASGLLSLWVLATLVGAGILAGIEILLAWPAVF